jgi:hypothetical protein
MNSKIEKHLSQIKMNDNDYKKVLLSYIESIKNIADKKPSIINQKSLTKEIEQYLKEINLLFDKIIIDKENTNIDYYESILRRDENTIRKLYGDLLHEKLLKEVLEEKIIILLQFQKEYELVKKKTGVIVCEGKVICNQRKDNEIVILRTENSTLKQVISDKEKEINFLNEKINLLNREISKLKKNKTNINININDINNPNLKNNRFTTINRAKEKDSLFNTIYYPNYFTQKELINNFPSTTQNFYKGYHFNTNRMNNFYHDNKSVDKSRDKSNKNTNINSHDNTIMSQEKKISVNKSKYSKKNSRNKKVSNWNYSSCENILNGNNVKYNLKFSNINNNNSTTKNSREKNISKKKLYSPLHEFNSVRYIISHSIDNSKEQTLNVPKSTRDFNFVSQNLSKNNSNSRFYSKFQKFNGLITEKKSEKNLKRMINGPKIGYLNLKRKQIGNYKNNNVSKEENSKENFCVLFQRTFNDNFKNDFYKK